jgi:hypothetical protein
MSVVVCIRWEPFPRPHNVRQRNIVFVPQPPMHVCLMQWQGSSSVPKLKLTFKEQGLGKMQIRGGCFGISNLNFPAVQVPNCLKSFGSLIVISGLSPWSTRVLSQ